MATTPDAARLDLRSIMAQYDDAKDEWDQAELWEHIPGLVAHIESLHKHLRDRETALDAVMELHRRGKVASSLCVECDATYPCPTLRAIAEATS